MAQVTAGLIDAAPDGPEVEIVNCCCWLCASETLLGVTDMEAGGFKVMLALADFVESATDVPFTVTVCVEVIEEGAV